MTSVTPTAPVTPVTFSAPPRPPRAAPRRRVRAVAAAAGLAAALVLTGCSDDDGGGGSGGDSAPPAPPATATPDAGGGTGGPGASTAPAGALEGSWLATTGGRPVVLAFTGGRAALFTTGGTLCSGTVREEAGTYTIRLGCADGDGDRVHGTVGSVGSSSLEVTWEGAVGTETYTKAEGGGLPTEGPGS